VFDRLGFRTAAREIFDHPEVQQEVARRVVTELVGEGEERGRVAHGLQTRLENRLTDALGSPALGMVLDGVLDLAWRVMVQREPKPVVIEATALRAIGLSLAEEHDPELAARIRQLPTPLRVEVLAADDVPSIAYLRGPVRVLVWVLAILTVLLAVLSVRLAGDKPLALRRLGLYVVVPQGLLVVLALLLPSLAADGVLMRIAYGVVLSHLIHHCAILIAAGFALYWIGRAGGWFRSLDQRLARIEARLGGDSPGTG
jgi:hypothetical protein